MLEAAVEAAPDHQVSLTDPDARLMVTGDRLAGVVGYNVQTAVETEHHLIIAHEVCRDRGINALVPKPDTSNARAAGRYGKEDFLYLPDRDAYRCPAGAFLTRRFESIEGGLAMSTYWTIRCPTCPLTSQCTTGSQRRVKRWKHEDVVEVLGARMKAIGDAMAIRRETVEHPFATIKAWMGATHFLCKGLKAVRVRR